MKSWKRFCCWMGWHSWPRFDPEFFDGCSIHARWCDCRGKIDSQGNLFRECSGCVDPSAPSDCSHGEGDFQLCTHPHEDGTYEFGDLIGLCREKKHETCRRHPQAMWSTCRRKLFCGSQRNFIAEFVKRGLFIAIHEGLPCDVIVEHHTPGCSTATV